MIQALANLVCAKGHRHYAPPREFDNWVGHQCLRGQSGMGGSCQSVLKPIEGKEPKK